MPPFFCATDIINIDQRLQTNIVISQLKVTVVKKQMIVSILPSEIAREFRQDKVIIWI